MEDLLSYLEERAWEKELALLFDELADDLFFRRCTPDEALERLEQIRERNR